VTTEVEERRPRWPVWYGPAAFVSGLLATLIVYSVVHAVAVGVGGDVSDDSPGFQLVGTLIQDALLVGAAVLFASLVAPPRPWQFGLRGAPLKSTLRMAGLAMLAFYVFVAIYIAALHPHGSQSVAKDLGADKGGIDMVLGAVLVVGVAPFAEEFFFRGFFYRALRSRCSVLVAAGIDGLVFGGIHYTDPKVLSLLPILAVLGFLFCLLYERTGTLFAPIALHSINNGIAYAGTVDGSAAISIGLAAGVVAGCVLTLRALPRRLTPV
jgi:membrane protease YdiL (CAAX protease family)